MLYQWSSRILKMWIHFPLVCFYSLISYIFLIWILKVVLCFAQWLCFVWCNYNRISFYLWPEINTVYFNKAIFPALLYLNWFGKVGRMILNLDESYIWAGLIDLMVPGQNRFPRKLRHTWASVASVPSHYRWSAIKPRLAIVHYSPQLERPSEEWSHRFYVTGF